MIRQNHNHRFQSTLRRTERPRALVRIDTNGNFNPRSGERSDADHGVKIATLLNFNPRSGERSDKEIRESAGITQISIHAPANGATFPLLYRTCNLLISIHAPANGATVFRRLNCWNICISIHAPANGATFSILYTASIFQYFNPRSGERSDQTRSLVQF